MRTYLDCIPCFFRQAIDAMRILGLEETRQKELIDEFSRALPGLPLTMTPPEIARFTNKLLQKYAKSDDVYFQVKRKSNETALKLYDRLKEKVNSSEDYLSTAVEIAIIGNIIDYGAKNQLEVDKELEAMLINPNGIIKQEKKRIFNYNKFKDVMGLAKTILYLADNAGETVFDRILLEEIKRIDNNKKIIYAIKDKPVLNDALAEDALFCGIDRYAEIISSGCDAPGTVLSLCNKEFLALYESADMIISKGQGNFEALSSSVRPLFFLFMVKCAVVAKHVDCFIGDIILLNKETA